MSDDSTSLNPQVSDMSTTEPSVSPQTDTKLVHIDQTSNKINLNPEPIDFEECLKDSPKFRQSLRENLAHVEHLEHHMSKAIKQVSHLIDTGREYVQSQQGFINSMRSLGNALGPSDTKTSKHINTLLETWQEITKLHEIVIDQSARSVGGSFSKFINEDLLKLREARKSFDKISNEYDQALLKYSQPIKKQQEDAENILIATSTAFTHTSLDLSIQLTTLQSKKGYEILESLLSLTKAQRTHFHQGYDLFEDLQPQLSDMEENLGNMQDDFETLTRNLPSKHLLVHNNELRPPTLDNKAHQVHLEGYLFKKASNGFRVWNRRWFVLKDHKLIYQKRSDTQPITMEEDLRLLTVRSIDKADNDRRFCFEIVSPHKSHILQADSEVACKTWMTAIQAGINAAFHDLEHKTRSPKLAVSSNEPCSGPSFTSWGSGFSLKSLQQQATSKLNSLTNVNEFKEGAKSTGKQGKGNNVMQSRKLDFAGSDIDDEDEQGDKYTTDEQGRSYAPLRDCDDDFKASISQNPVHNSTGFQSIYPTATVMENRQNSSQATDPPEKPQRAYMIILAMPGNEICADCSAPQPRWASINLGITLCIECAGIHRSLGVHLSKVRSLTLDTDIWSPEIVQLMLNLGNSSVNSAYLACYDGQRPMIDADSSREERESWIKDKYLLKRFMRRSGVELDDSVTVEENQPTIEEHRAGESTTNDQAVRPDVGDALSSRDTADKVPPISVVKNNRVHENCGLVENERVAGGSVTGEKMSVSQTFLPVERDHDESMSEGKCTTDGPTSYGTGLLCDGPLSRPRPHHKRYYQLLHGDVRMLDMHRVVDLEVSAFGITVTGYCSLNEQVPHKVEHFELWAFPNGPKALVEFLAAADKEERAPGFIGSTQTQAYWTAIISYTSGNLSGSRQEQMIKAIEQFRQMREAEEKKIESVKRLEDHDDRSSATGGAME